MLRSQLWRPLRHRSVVPVPPHVSARAPRQRFPEAYRRARARRLRRGARRGDNRRPGRRAGRAGGAAAGAARAAAARAGRAHAACDRFGGAAVRLGSAAGLDRRLCPPCAGCRPELQPRRTTALRVDPMTDVSWLLCFCLLRQMFGKVRTETWPYRWRIFVSRGALGCGPAVSGWTAECLHMDRHLGVFLVLRRGSVAPRSCARLGAVGFARLGSALALLSFPHTHCLPAVRKTPRPG